MEVEVEGRTLSLSNLDKVFYPETGFTKGQVIEYYTRVAPVLLPHLRDRHLTLKRYPNGVDGDFFYEKQCPRHRPDWVRTAASGRATTGARSTTAWPTTSPTVVWLANLADLEMHTPLARADAPKEPTVLAFDLDPGPPAGIVRVRGGGVPPARRVRPLRPARVPEDVGLEGHADLRPAQHADHATRRPSRSPRASPRCSSAGIPT